MNIEERRKVRVLIVDDEPPARASIRTLLAGDPEVEIVGECSCGTEAVSATRDQKPDLMFLDVQMPECDGFDVLELLGSEMPRAVVFVTAYDQFALRAFDAGALDYLLKPFDNRRFEVALSRAKERLQGQNREGHKVERFVIKSSGQVLFVSAGEIDWIEAADYYSCLHVGNKTHLIRRSMAELEGDLDPRHFCRIHRSAIVNLSRVQAIESNPEGEFEARLASGTRVRLSRRYRKLLQARLRIAAL
jgi:two-component system LytT family response regulator